MDGIYIFFIILAIFIVIILLVAVFQGTKLANGATCTQDSDCESGLCAPESQLLGAPLVCTANLKV